jgi:hypothetical protein
MSVLQRILSPVVNRLVLALWWQMSRHWRLVSKPVVSSIIGDVAAHILAHQYESSVCNLSLMLFRIVSRKYCVLMLSNQ